MKERSVNVEQTLVKSPRMSDCARSDVDVNDVTIWGRQGVWEAGKCGQDKMGHPWEPVTTTEGVVMINLSTFFKSLSNKIQRPIGTNRLVII